MAQDRMVVMVTGAGGNVGQALVRRLARRNAVVVALNRGAAPPASRSKSDDDRLVLSDVDLTSREACEAAVGAALNRFHQIDALAHTVGGFAMAPADAGALDVFERMFRLNLVTTLNIFSAVLPGMRSRRRGALVAVAAGAALRGAKGMAAYSASKAGLLRLVESLAEEEKAQGVRVNAVLPSIIDTPQNRAAMPKADFAAWVQPDEVAAVMEFLLVDDSSGVTGASVPAPGRV